MVISGQRCMLSLTERGGPWTLLGSGATMGSAPNCASPRAKFCGCVGSRASAAVELGREIRDRRGDGRDAAARRAAAASLGALGLLVRLVVGLVPGPLQQRLLGEDVHGAGLVLGRR
ncbi:unnamed protein product [Prorocentrum cordatum]|uniref:Uncharacterized protein n=1 Tax=Prorocentrum cordatum TaxID=2364126 RepID=A0ABN9PD29_9DINO|nr:unnamed protein product [Polarella glacialis]